MDIRDQIVAISQQRKDRGLEDEPDDRNGIFQELPIEFPNSDLRGADLRYVNLERANLQGANLQGANLQGANLQGANLQGANLEGANLQGVYFMGANLEGANLTNAKASGSFMNAILKDTNFTGANLAGSQFGGPTSGLQNTNFTGANLTDSRFVIRGFEGSKFDNANFVRVSFERLSDINMNYLSHFVDLGKEVFRIKNPTIGKCYKLADNYTIDIGFSGAVTKKYFAQEKQLIFLGELVNFDNSGARYGIKSYTFRRYNGTEKVINEDHRYTPVLIESDCEEKHKVGDVAMTAMAPGNLRQNPIQTSVLGNANMRGEINKFLLGGKTTIKNKNRKYKKITSKLKRKKTQKKLKKRKNKNISKK